ncbi:tetratricopeptide repeat protein [Candidatus Poribacteria bacterium]|jgi:tetratricopeptide (TPR) repeat protein|nr:tetratricopeptide repeat protein [Candidatus Poribacteria bacterium]MBT5531686.1 tetratricopeptide repeat protein [Candidatus Poribacteria bacterium]MBT5710976.1 tetratricopeptide repeat protein [Candidatus Poribacteria bacterium]MBT7096079.1 tetratricopeptide repeat protein [Candidatus Poribacteria bacterium]MBT7804970.1 tetratricopeptide repeat protein [Candidatus Poribacteria bacterium]
MKLVYVILGAFVVVIGLWAGFVLPGMDEGASTGAPPESVLFNEAHTVAKLRVVQARDGGDWDLAIQAYTAALAIRPENAEAQNDLGACYYHKALRQLGDPVEEDLRGYSHDPTDAITYISEKLAAGGKFTWDITDDVLLLLEDYLDGRGDLIYARTPVGMDHRVTLIGGQTVPSMKLAEAHLRRSMDLKPDYAPAYRNVGAMYVTQGRVKAGTYILDQALRLEPGDGELARYIRQLRG